MNAPLTQPLNISEAARLRFLAEDRRPFFLGNWERALFIHYELDAALLQRQIPFELELWHEAAIVSVVAFSMRRFRLAVGGKLTETLLRPIANHEFLNVRTYVRSGSQVGIYFIAEWVNNRVNRWLGPPIYGLPYRFGRIHCRHQHEEGFVSGNVNDSFRYEGIIPQSVEFQPCAPDSLDEFLLEHYSAFTCQRGIARRFDIWHEPWRQTAVELRVKDDLLRETGPWFDRADRIGANYSPGAEDIWMGAPRRIR